MIIEFTVCNAITGEILRTGTIPQSEYYDILLQARSNETVFGIKYDQQKQYLSDIAQSIFSNKPPLGAIADKLTALANNADTITISGLPVPTRVLISGPISAELTETDGVLSLTFDFPGTYIVHLSALNKLDQEIALVAN